MNFLWVVFTLAAAAGQTARNALQRELSGPLGAAGATHVRFLFALPFAVLFLIMVLIWHRASLPRISVTFLVWLAVGALTQIIATLLMLLTMQHRSFVALAHLRPIGIQDEWNVRVVWWLHSERTK